MNDKFTINNAEVPTLNLKPDYTIAFLRDGKQIGILDFNGPTMTFEGDAEDSAKVFFDWIAQLFADSHPMRKAEADIALLRSALVGLIGFDTEAELGQMEATIRLLPAPEADKAISINAIHALLATMPPSSGD